MDKAQMKRHEIIDWAVTHNAIINPSKGMEMYVENFFKFGHCPCDSNRTMCPCTEALDDIERKGCCLCRLFWRDLETFKATLRSTSKRDEKEAERTNPAYD